MSKPFQLHFMMMKNDVWGGDFIEEREEWSESHNRVKSYNL